MSKVDKIEVKTRSGRSATRLSQVLLGSSANQGRSAQIDVKHADKLTTKSRRVTRKEQVDKEAPNKDTTRKNEDKTLENKDEKVRSSKRLRKGVIAEETQDKLKRYTRKPPNVAGKAIKPVNASEKSRSSQRQAAKEEEIKASTNKQYISHHKTFNNTKLNESQHKTVINDTTDILITRTRSSTRIEKLDSKQTTDKNPKTLKTKESTINTSNLNNSLEKTPQAIRSTRNTKQQSKHLENTESNNSVQQEHTTEITTHDHNLSTTISEEKNSPKKPQKQKSTKIKNTTKVNTNRRSSRSSRISFTTFRAKGTSTPLTANLKTSTNLRKQTPNKNKSPTKTLKDKTKEKQSINKRQSRKSKINLRGRQQNKKYQEFETSQSGDDENEDQHVPVYKKHIKAKVRKFKDIYEFEADSSEKCPSDSGNDYDKEMVEEMAIIKKLEKKKTVKIGKPKTKAVKAKQKLENPKIVTKAVPKSPNQLQITNIEKPNKDTTGKSKIIANKINLKEIKVIHNVEVNLTADRETELNYDNLPEVEIERNVDENTENPKLDGKSLITSLVDSFLQPDPVDASIVIDNQEKSTFKKSFLVEASIGQLRRSSFNPAASPRRSNLVLRNGPYYLQTKGDSLPAFNQEVVLNSTLVESHEPTFNCRLSAILPRPDDTIHGPPQDVVTSSPAPVTKSKTKQTTILKFIGKEVEENSMECSLFDENLLLSPVKTSSPMVKVGNCSMKTRALRDVTNLQMQSSVAHTPARDASDVEFFALGDSGVHNGPKPTRFPVKSPKQLVNEKWIEDVVEETINRSDSKEEPSVMDSPVSQTEEDAEDTASKQDVVGIFEDFGGLEVTRTELPSFTYARRRKRVRVMSYHSDNEDKDEGAEATKPKRKKKGEMTKKAKKEYEEWAASFNKMLDDVNQDRLEVE